MRRLLYISDIIGGYPIIGDIIGGSKEGEVTVVGASGWPGAVSQKYCIALFCVFICVCVSFRESDKLYCTIFKANIGCALRRRKNQSW